jgi:hypothetical protein
VQKDGNMLCIPEVPWEVSRREKQQVRNRTGEEKEKKIRDGYRTRK